MSIDRVEELPDDVDGADGAGRVRVRATFGDVSHATEVLPGLAAHVRVVEPEGLRGALRDLAEQVRLAAG